ncbi:MAG: flavoprotein [Rhizobiales bacterium 32-66-8]|nr:MAG: flavoprotein [Rhizobiales bacterium 32-66-8]
MAKILPVAVIGAGPVGLAAAAHLVARGIIPVVFERGTKVASSMRDFSHVRLFSPWRYNVDEAARALLEETGWKAPDPDALPTAGEMIDTYLALLAAHPSIEPQIMLGTEVTAIGRLGLDRMSSAGRADAPFQVGWKAKDGRTGTIEAHAVIDASGTWSNPSPMGADGMPVKGEAMLSDVIGYGIPNVLGPERPRYADKRVLIVGSGHSATNVALDLVRLRDEEPGTEILWGLRKAGIGKLFRGGLDDQLPERGALGLAAGNVIEDGRVKVLAPLAIRSVERNGDTVTVAADLNGSRIVLEVDRIVVATGFRPNFDMLRELRVAIDPITEAPPALAPLIDPNVHSCGSVPPHGAVELAHPEPDFYIVGSKSYGRAPTFLMATGYEQVRSVVAEIAGDREAARRVQLVLPETGVCSAPSVPSRIVSGCCGGPAPKDVEACCADDAGAKAEGKSGCGCGSAA